MKSYFQKIRLGGSDMPAKEKVIGVLANLPDDSTLDGILSELAFERMIERGLADAREGRVISHEEVGRRIRQWQTTA